jgi:DNA-binding transcriptional LysR family regulator
MDISTRQLEQIRILAELKHFGRAAEALAMSQPALTRSIQRLEESLGVKLFDRSRRRGVELTDFGRLVLDRGQDLLLHAGEMLREIRLRKGLEIGELAVETGFMPNEFLVNRAVGRLIRRHPRIRCQVRMSNWRDAAERVLALDADLAVAELSEAMLDDRLQCELLGRFPFGFVCRSGHPLLERDSFTLAAIFEYPIVATLAPNRISAEIGDQLGRAGYRDARTGFFVPSLVVGDFWAAVQVARESDAVAAAPRGSLLPAIYRGQLREIDFWAPWMVLETGIIVRRHRTPSAAAQALIDELRAVAAELVAETPRAEATA